MKLTTMRIRLSSTNGHFDVLECLEPDGWKPLATWHAEDRWQNVRATLWFVANKEEIHLDPNTNEGIATFIAMYPTQKLRNKLRRESIRLVALKLLEGTG